MNWGMENRLARIIKPADKRAVMLAVDLVTFSVLPAAWKIRGKQLNRSYHTPTRSC